MSDRKKSIIALVIAFVLFIGLFGGLFIHPNIQERRGNAEMEENNRRFEISRQLHYADRMFFEVDLAKAHSANVYRLDHIQALFISDRLDIAGVVFVHSAEENVGFPDDVLVAWPTYMSERLAEVLRGAPFSSDLNTVQMVDEWEAVFEAWISWGSMSDATRGGLIADVEREGYEREEAAAETEE